MQLNLLANSMLLERSKENGLRLGLSVSSWRYGVAVAALVGTVFGMHERINAAIVGEGNMAQTQSPLFEPVAAPADSDVAVAPSRMSTMMLTEAVVEAEGDKAKSEIILVTMNAVKKSTVERGPVRNKTGPVGERIIQGSEWIAAQPGGNFTLQLLATSEQRELEGFVGKHPALKSPLGRFEQQRGNKRLHVLTQGSYPNREQAEAAAKALPAKLQPWIRDFAGITKAMSAPVNAAAATEIAAIGNIKDTAWVWSQNPTHYTIQLAGAVDEVSINEVMRGLNLPGELAVVQILRNDKPWYALIYGRFTDMAVAHGTIARLPEKLQKAGPWIRRFSDLQSEIGQAGVR